jgi:hypothetical protein
MKFYNRRVLLYSGNRKTGTTNSYTIVLPLTLQDVVRIEWLNTSIPGYMVSIQGFTENVSSGGTPYWRFLDTYSNQRWYDGIDEKFEYRVTQRSLNTLVIALFNPDGTAATIVNEHTIELAVTCSVFSPDED